MRTSSETLIPGDNKASNQHGRCWRTSALAGALFLVTPLVVFLRYQSYPLFEPEALACIGVLAVAGAVVGLTLEIFGSWGRALMYALMIAVTVDIQSDRPERWQLLGGAFLVSLAVVLLLRHRLPRLGIVLLTASFLISAFGPTDRRNLGKTSVYGSAPGNPDLPIVVHLILDGHIGVEGIPAEIDTDGSEARRVRDLYLKHGFRVFGRAYSRYYRTHNSIPAVLNFHDVRATRYYVKNRGPDWILKSNQYFEVMTNRGYAIHVIQSTYMDYCSDDDFANIESCWTFDPERLNVIRDTNLGIRHKMRTIFGVYSRLSSMATELEIPTAEVTPIATLPVLEELGDEIAAAKPGNLYFAHLLLPHSPYGLLADCQVRPQLGSWLMNHDKTMLPRRNTPATRFLRYPLYLAQLQCVCRRIDEFLQKLETSPHADNMIIIIHGDHGSRLDCGPPEMKYKRQLTDSDYIDAYTTLFVIKQPGASAGYDRRVLPIDQLFDKSIRNGTIPEGVDWASEPQVLMRKGRKLRPMALPHFERDLDQTSHSSP